MYNSQGHAYQCVTLGQATFLALAITLFDIKICKDTYSLHSILYDILK